MENNEKPEGQNQQVPFKESAPAEQTPSQPPFTSQPPVPPTAGVQPPAPPQPAQQAWQQPQVPQPPQPAQQAWQQPQPQQQWQQPQQPGQQQWQQPGQQQWQQPGQQQWQQPGQQQWQQPGQQQWQQPGQQQWQQGQQYSQAPTWEQLKASGNYQIPPEYPAGRFNPEGFNWLCFFFSWIWYLVKGMWQKAVVLLIAGWVLSYVTFGLAGIAVSIYAGIVGYRDYMRFYNSKQQFWF